MQALFFEIGVGNIKGNIEGMLLVNLGRRTLGRTVKSTIPSGLFSILAYPPRREGLLIQYFSLELR